VLLTATGAFAGARAVIVRRRSAPTLSEWVMIAIEALVPAKLPELQPGSMFVETDKALHYLAGSVGDEEVFLTLSGSHPFYISKRSVGRSQRGYLLNNVRFEVDPPDAMERYDVDEAKIGELACHAGGYGIGGYDGHSPHFVALSGVPEKDQEPRHALAFSRWQLSIEQDAERIILFSYDGSQWRPGPLLAGS
jgi:hypothetical protein